MKITVVVHANAKVEKIVQGDVWHIFVKEPARKGKANKRVIELLAKHFNVAKKDIKVIAGLTSKKKLIEVINE